MTQSSLRDRLLSGTPNGAAKAADTIPAKTTTPAAAAASATPKAGAPAPAASNALSRLRAASEPNPVAVSSAQQRMGNAAAPQTNLPSATVPQANNMSTMAARLAQKAKDAEVLAAGVARAEADRKDQDARIAAESASLANDSGETEVSGEVSEPPDTFDTLSEHQPYDINPPESPENPLSDADELTAANAALSPPKKGRPAGSKNAPKAVGVAAAPVVIPVPTGKSISDEAYIFAQVYGKVLEAVFRDPKTFSDVVIGDEAGSAVRAFLDLKKSLEKE